MAINIESEQASAPSDEKPKMSTPPPLSMKLSKNFTTLPGSKALMPSSRILNNTYMKIGFVSQYRYKCRRKNS